MLTINQVILNIKLKNKDDSEGNISNGKTQLYVCGNKTVLNKKSMQLKIGAYNRPFISLVVQNLDKVVETLSKILEKNITKGRVKLLNLQATAKVEADRSTLYDKFIHKLILATDEKCEVGVTQEDANIFTNTFGDFTPIKQGNYVVCKLSFKNITVKTQVARKEKITHISIVVKKIDKVVKQIISVIDSVCGEKTETYSEWEDLLNTAYLQESEEFEDEIDEENILEDNLWWQDSMMSTGETGSFKHIELVPNSFLTPLADSASTWYKKMDKSEKKEFRITENVKELCEKMRDDLKKLLAEKRYINMFKWYNCTPHSRIGIFTRRALDKFISCIASRLRLKMKVKMFSATTKLYTIISEKPIDDCVGELDADVDLQSGQWSVSSVYKSVSKVDELTSELKELNRYTSSLNNSSAENLNTFNETDLFGCDLSDISEPEEEKVVYKSKTEEIDTVMEIPKGCKRKLSDTSGGEDFNNEMDEVSNFLSKRCCSSISALEQLEKNTEILKNTSKNVNVLLGKIESMSKAMYGSQWVPKCTECLLHCPPFHAVGAPPGRPRNEKINVTCDQ